MRSCIHDQKFILKIKIMEVKSGKSKSHKVTKEYFSWHLGTRLSAFQSLMRLTIMARINLYYFLMDIIWKSQRKNQIGWAPISRIKYKSSNFKVLILWFKFQVSCMNIIIWAHFWSCIRYQWSNFKVCIWLFTF